MHIFMLNTNSIDQITKQNKEIITKLKSLSNYVSNYVSLNQSII